MLLKESKDDIPEKIVKMIAPELLPPDLKPNLTIEDFNQWLKRRSIPDNREGLDEMKRVFGDEWLKNYRYLSLSDHYWIKHREREWKSVNYFTRRYLPTIGDMAFKPWEVLSKKIDPHSPDLTTSGVLRKRWVQAKDLSSYLVKAASIEYKQEPLSEVLVSVLVEQLDLPHLKSAGYDLHIEGTAMCSKCKNFVTPETDLVLASQFYQDTPRPKEESVYTHLIKACEAKEIPYAKEFIDALIFIDRLTENTDRHLGNIGFLRDIKTMKFIGPAPLFDCGSAYWGTKQNLESREQSDLFHDVEAQIFNRMKKKINLESIINTNRYENIINQYPGLSDSRKEALIKAIEKKNLAICENREFERER